MGGFDITKDDENLSSLKFNDFYKRTLLMTKLRNKAEQLTGEKKDAFLNITAETKEMQKRAKFLHDHGWNYAMIDVVVSGTAAVQTLRETLGDYGMAIHAHRAMHASFDRNPKHGMSMQFIANLMRMIGVDQIHSGTAVGKLVGSKEEVRCVADVLRDKHTKPHKNILVNQDWGNIKSGFPVTSGGLHPGLVPDVMKIYGNEMVMLVSGGIHGHPKGTRAGAKASMQAIEATQQNISLEQYAKTHAELRQSLEKWGRMKPE